ncbi:transcriptional regulator, BadM/Rrf2 family [Desulfonatronum thiosulfatophilum]|uniref:Transcriptional regulator, BadM/Rrf2 family n=1 Tax=Desulfonatronum thiosulfatophilum TaxID=617002 RepID=A0A1G6AIB6_9BACT|nr:Rrf2 family transcriptional regulator [Desulfonatronum thiosulfatophilum]SDB08115.1 transcriptional regulator, BadM/Rrf2 family [Desulfonatronum thiosulfatophilum]
MMLTKAGEYAVRCMLFLAGERERDVVLKKDVSEAMKIPGSFLAKIAQNLAKAGLIQIVQGPRGGYRMLKSAEEVTLLEVIEAVEGEIFLNECLFRPDSCHRSLFCGVHQVWEKAREGLRETLSVPLSDLLCMENSRRSLDGGEDSGSQSDS